MIYLDAILKALLFAGAYFWKFTGLDAMNFKEFVASGASDEEVDRWIRENATQKDLFQQIRSFP